MAQYYLMWIGYIRYLVYHFSPNIKRKPFLKFDLLLLMKILLLILLLILPTAAGGTYTLGSHQVSFNVSEPYNSSAKLDTPYYNLSASNDWTYVLNMTVDSRHSIKVLVNELTVPDYGRTWTSSFAASRSDWIKANGIGGYKASTLDFKGYPAYQESYPAQTIYPTDGRFVEYLQHNNLDYEIDEKTIVHVLSVGDNVPYQEILDTIEVTDAPKTPTKYAPYVG